MRLCSTFVIPLAEDSDLIVPLGGLGHTAGLSCGCAVTAEGVETDEQFAAVRGEGCDDLQGYYIGWPLPLHKFEERMGAGRWQAHSPGAAG